MPFGEIRASIVIRPVKGAKLTWFGCPVCHFRSQCPDLLLHKPHRTIVTGVDRIVPQDPVVGQLSISISGLLQRAKERRPRKHALFWKSR